MLAALAGALDGLPSGRGAKRALHCITPPSQTSVTSSAGHLPRESDSTRGAERYMGVGAERYMGARTEKQEGVGTPSSRAAADLQTI